MAMKMPSQRKSKRLLMSLLALTFLSWLILFGWAMSIWALSGFDKAWLAIKALSSQQAAAISEFNDASVAEPFKDWFAKLPTEHISQKVTHASAVLRDELNTVMPEENAELGNVVEDVLILGKQVWLIARLAAHVMLIKLMILLAAIPLFVLATTAGLIDGLNQRAIRTASLGRESSYVFHQLNRYFKRGLLLLLALWLAIPISITPALMFVPVSLLISLMVSITASRFKKYL
ncbi:TIGR03747 family integrating conjugative element membrane protein [Legionella sp. CNM-4043-24]|uniref:TIGR03747 family integrating conjugative element membrane protein n=1 Tax=Legionella sp. CNM-4043-24 TaxID=3421646 RepID=UPI00403B06B3